MININEEELQCKICYDFLYETVICDICSNAFCQECATNYKKKAKKYGRVDKCPICGSNNFTFTRCEEIDKLIKKRKHKPVQCQHCKRIFFDKEKFEEHIQGCKYQCKFCLMMFDKEDDLLRHIKKNNQELFKAIDLMNASKNKVQIYNEEKPRKKKLVKKKTKEIFINNDLKAEKKEDEKKVEEKKGEEKKIYIKKEIEKKRNDKKLEEKKIDEKLKDEIKEDEKQEEKEKTKDEIRIEEDNKKEKEKEKGGEKKSELTKKIIKKKIVKKKKKIPKKKDGMNPNTINYSENKLNEENLLKTKLNKTNIEKGDKLSKEINKFNISAEINLNEKQIIEKNITNKDARTLKKINSSIITDNINIKNKTFNNSETNKYIGLYNSISISQSKAKLPKKYNEKEDELLPIKSNSKELIIPFSEEKMYYSHVIEEEEKISKYVDYLNNPRPESVKPSTIPGDAKLDPEYDLYYCGKPNRIDCICCTDHRCRPGACMCISCMKLNKKYHKLKSHYLINKCGRACKYSHGYFHCYCKYTHIVHDVGNNIFKPVYRCQGENICKPCEEITLLMETYLPNSICQKLRDRETKQAQF